MKLTKDVLKRIIKEELEIVLSESMIKPTIGGSITPEQQGKIDELIYSQKPKFLTQARQLIDAFGGNPNYVDDLLEMIAQGIIPLAHSHEDVAERFPPYDESTDQSRRDFYNATVGQEYEARKELDKYSATPAQRKAAQDMYFGTGNARRAARLKEGMGPDHPDYDMLGGIISRVLMAVLMKGADIESAMDMERVPEEHRDYVRERVMAMSGR